jgi:hypothetical protein
MRYAETPHALRAVTVQADLGQIDECRALVARACAQLPGGEIDILINNAGILPRLGMSIESTTAEEYAATMDVNLRAPFIVLQVSCACLARVHALANHLCDKTLTKSSPSTLLHEQESIGKMPRGAAVVNVGSLAAVRPLANLTVYSMSKCGLEVCGGFSHLNPSPPTARCHDTLTALPFSVHNSKFCSRSCRAWVRHAHRRGLPTRVQGVTAAMPACISHTIRPSPSARPLSSHRGASALTESILQPS